MKLNLTTLCLATAVCIILSLTASAQKLPSEQKESVYAPANVQIDGKPTEWAGKFQARNSATLLTYVMANDADYLYFTLQADDMHAIGKIFYDGITIGIKSRKDKKMPPLNMTYPMVKPVERTEIVLPMRDKNNNTDSVVAVVNEWLNKSAKTIALSGFAGISDPDVSVYNELGLKAAVQADHSRTLTFEYRIPLKYIKSLLDDAASFDYSITLNGAKLAPGTIVIGGVSTTGGGSAGGGSAGLNEVFSPTYLKATYTLAAK